MDMNQDTEDSRTRDFREMEERPSGGGGGLGVIAAVVLLAAVIGIGWGFYEVGLHVAYRPCAPPAPVVVR
jgi:hypothetical protein